MFVDGVLMKSCLMPVAKAQGAKIDTIESLAKTGELTVLQKAFHKAGASQCGYCIPGMVMAATAALRANPFADREEIKERLGGNICRCTGYQKIFDAVELARDVQNGRLPASALPRRKHAEGDFIGKNVRRIDAPSKVTGRLKYAGDMRCPACCMCRCCVRRTPHARIVSIDTSAAEAMEGVEGVITSADVPGQDGFGVFVNDQPMMARGKVRYVGEAVAAVAAEDLLTAKRALAAIKVVYEPLPAVFDADEAMRPGAPVLHDYAPDNVTKHIPIRVGDVEKGFAECDLVVEETYSTQAIEHAYLEPEAGLAYVDHDGVVTVVSPEPEHHPSPPHAGAHHRQADQQSALHHEPGRRRLRRQGGHDLPGHAGAARDEDAAAGAAGVHARGVDRLDRQAPSLAHDAAHGADARWPHPRADAQDDLRRRRLRAVDRRRHAQGGDPGGRALRHPQCAGRHLRHLHQQHAVRRLPLVRRAADAVRDRDAISTSAPSGSGSIRSRSGASMRCATAA